MTKRTPQDYAIEHAGYLANAAEAFIKAVNEDDLQRLRIEEGDGEADPEAAKRAAADRLEAATNLRRCVYEFRKRAATPPWRVAEVWSSPNPDRTVLWLAEGESEIERVQAHESFIRWVSPAPKQPKAAQPAKPSSDIPEDVRNALEMIETHYRDDPRIKPLRRFIESPPWTILPTEWPRD